LKTGQPSDGLRVIGEALERVRTTGGRVWEPELVRLEGELRLAASPADVADARGSFRQAMEIARQQSARSWELRAAVSLARTLVAEGRRDEAHRTVADVYEWFTEGLDTADLKDARALLDGCRSLTQ
jgi:predicted ATPase